MKMNYVLGQINLDGDLFDKLPGWAKLMVIIIMLSMFIFIAVKYGAEAIKLIREKKRKGKISSDALKSHSFFSKCDSWTKYKVNELYFGDETRNRLFRTIVKTKIQVMSTQSMEMLTKSDIKCMSKPCFQTAIFNMFTGMQTETQLQIKNNILEMFPRNGQRIYDLVVAHETKGFNAFNQITDNYTERLVQIICESELYSDNLEKYEMILDAFKSALGAVFPHIESAFKGFNGELDEIIKG